MNHIELRPWDPADRESLAAHGNNPKIAANMTDAFPSPYDLKAADRFIESVTKDSPPGILAIVVDGVACGGIGIHPDNNLHRKNAEMGYWLGEEYWDRGIVTKVIPPMIKYAFENWDIERIYARPFGRNMASQRVLEKCGFILEGRFQKTLIKQGKMEDELVYAVRKSNSKMSI